MEKLIVNATNRCNFKCGHCFREGATNEDLDPALFARVTGDLRRVGIERLNVTGGEPILHPKFAELIELFARHHFMIGVVTNGWLAERYLEVLAPYKRQIEYVAVSLDSHQRAEHDRLRRKGSFDRVVRAIDAFRAAGYRVNVSHIVSARTAPRLMAFCSFIKSRDVCVNLGRVVATPGNGGWRIDADGLRQLRFAAGLFKQQLGRRASLGASLGISRNLAFCSNMTAMDSIMLRYDGDVLFCCDALRSNRGAVLGNISDEPFADIVARFTDKLRPLLDRRIAAIAAGRGDTCNDCDFCNTTLAATACDDAAAHLAVSC